MKTLNTLTQERYDLVTEIIELRRKIRIKENKLEYIKKLIAIELDEDTEPNLHSLQKVTHDI